ncbi:transposase, partial [Rhizobium miluonense]
RISGLYSPHSATTAFHKGCPMRNDANDDFDDVPSLRADPLDDDVFPTTSAARERTDANRLKPWGKAIYKRRKETVERSFADAKQLHGHRYARFRSLIRVQCQCLMAAAAQNIKKIAMALTKASQPSPA